MLSVRIRWNWQFRKTVKSQSIKSSSADKDGLVIASEVIACPIVLIHIDNHIHDVAFNDLLIGWFGLVSCLMAYQPL